MALLRRRYPLCGVLTQAHKSNVATLNARAYALCWKVCADEYT